MKNYTEREVVIVDPSTYAVVRTIPSEGVRVVVSRGDQTFLGSIEGIPVVGYAPVTVITGLEGVYGDIIVPLVVAEGMRSLGYRHQGRVFTPQQLIFAPGPERKVLGTPGLILHADISLA